MVTNLSGLSNTQLAQVFNALTGQTVKRFTSIADGKHRIERALPNAGMNLAEAMRSAGIEVDGFAEPKTVREAIAQLEPEQTTPEPVDPMAEHLANMPPMAHEKPTRTRKAKADKPKRENRLEQVLALLRRDEGATVPEIMTATGWQPHTTRAYLSRGGAAGKAVTIMTDRVERDGGKVTVYSAR